MYAYAEENKGSTSEWLILKQLYDTTLKLCIGTFILSIKIPSISQ